MKFLILILATLINSAAFAANKLGCENVIDFNQHKGQTYLSFMKETVKPILDDYATNGYILANKKDVERTLNKVSSKVQWKALKAAKSKENLLAIVEQLEGQTANLYDLPGMIADVDNRVDRYTLSTFLGLASCGGAIIEYSKGNVAYNIHYGTGEFDKDDRTGRSFGEGVGVRDADDASDKNYLKDLEEFVTEHDKSIDDFYGTLVKSLANSDASDMPKISKFGQLLLTDFLAVYTAEQARNLMDGKVHVHWDAALLEVTLMGAFHAGQENIKIFYKDPYTGESTFTDTVYNQDNGCSDDERKVRSVRLYDYWQFSSSTDPSHCRRSGINITKKEFRKLGTLISKYQRENNPELVSNVERHFSSNNRGKNVFYQLSKFFINTNTPDSLGEKNAEDLAEDFTNFLLQVKKDAKKITSLIESGELK